MIDKRKTLVKIFILESMYNYYCVIYKDQT